MWVRKSSLVVTEAYEQHPAGLFTPEYVAEFVWFQGTAQRGDLIVGVTNHGPYPDDGGFHVATEDGWQ